ncbi:MAG: hypothetical protein ACJAVR_000646 [Paracoccaceae bacterium]|jgi:hypothetical protein
MTVPPPLLTDRAPDPVAPSFTPRLKPRRAQALAAVVPVLGAFLLMPPYITVFAAPETVFGVPLILAYLMVVWVGLIFSAWRLSGRLRRRLELNAPRPRLAPGPPRAADSAVDPAVDFGAPDP